MPNQKGPMTKEEVLILATGRTRTWPLNPFKSIKSRLEAATEGNPRLRRIALWSASRTSVEDDIAASAWLWLVMPSVLLLCVLLGNVLGSSGLPTLVGVLSFPVSLVAMWSLSSAREAAMQRVVKHPLLDCYGGVTGMDRLDALLAMDPFEADALLLGAGMDYDEVRRLSLLAHALARNPEEQRDCAEGMLRMRRLRELSPSAIRLLDRAYQAMGGGVPESLPSPSESLGHLGVDLSRAGVPR